MSKRRDQPALDRIIEEDVIMGPHDYPPEDQSEGADDREGGGDPFEEEGNTGHDDPDPDADFALPPSGNPQADRAVAELAGKGATLLATNAQINDALRALEARHKAELKQYRQEKKTLLNYLNLLLEFPPLRSYEPK